MTTLEQLRARRTEILALARQCGLKDIKVFGSVARGEDRPDSDIDILVSSIPGEEKGLATFGFPIELEEMFGRKIDMVFEKGLFWAMKDEVLKDAKPL